MIIKEIMEYIKKRSEKINPNRKINTGFVSGEEGYQSRTSNGYKSAENKDFSLKKNFWNYFPLILFIINLAIAIFYSLQPDLELGAILVFFYWGLIFLTIPLVILAFLGTWKTVSNILASILLLPPLLFLLSMLILPSIHEKKVTKVISNINEQIFVPVAVHKNDVLLPRNIVIRLKNINTPLMFENIFQKEIVEKKKEVRVILEDRPYTITFIARLDESWLKKGEKYRLIEGNLYFNDSIIDQNFILQEGGKYKSKTALGYITKISDQPLTISNARDYFFLPSVSSAGEEMKIIIPDSAICFDDINQRIGCYQDIETIRLKYPGESVLKFFEKDGEFYVTEIKFQK